MRIIRFSGTTMPLSWSAKLHCVVDFLLWRTALDIERKRIDQDFCIDVLFASVQKSPESPILFEYAQCAF